MSANQQASKSVPAGISAGRTMTQAKTDKELAFLQDLFVATDWGERFGELINEHVTLPKEGRVLYLAAGTGAHAIALQERSSAGLRFVCVDENEKCLELARAKATFLKDAAEFRREGLDHLSLQDNAFDLVIGDGSLVPIERIRGMLSEMVRAAAPGSTVALSLPTFSSFGEFFSIYWEALHNCGVADHESDVESLISILPSVSAVEEMSEQAGLDDVASWTKIEEFAYDSGETFLSSPLISDFLMQRWLASLPAHRYEEVIKEIGRLINEDRHEAEFSLTVKATLVIGKKALNQ
jgi:ubiquinone/menaquinone biosynthesis C-methylase UbiE